jgi:hypothetical protein
MSLKIFSFSRKDMSSGGILVTKGRMKYMLPTAADTGDYYINLENVLINDSTFITTLGSTFYDCTGSFAYVKAPTGAFTAITGGSIFVTSETVKSITGVSAYFTGITGADVSCVNSISIPVPVGNTGPSRLGSFFFNTLDNKLYVYNGSAWIRGSAYS